MNEIKIHPYMDNGGIFKQFDKVNIPVRYLTGMKYDTHFLYKCLFSLKEHPEKLEKVLNDLITSALTLDNNISKYLYDFFEENYKDKDIKIEPEDVPCMRKRTLKD